MLKSYKELSVWQKSIELVIEIYNLSGSSPKNEIYGLTSQMRRAAVSIPSNLAEAYSRKHRQEYVQFVRIAFGSDAELETQLEIARKLNFASIDKFKKLERLLGDIMKMLNRLISAPVAKP